MGLEARDDRAATARRTQRRITQHLGRFRPEVREAVRTFARSGPRRLDLTVVFPGAAVQIATNGNGAAASRLALKRIDQGAPLKEVTRALGVPGWMRRLPPEAFQGPLRALDDDEVFARRIATALPRSRTNSAEWLAAVLFALDTAGAEFAVWLARMPVHGGLPRSVPVIRMLAAHAWYSAHPALPASRLIMTRWRPDLSLDTALAAAKMWFNRIRLVVTLGSPSARLAPWLQSGAVGELRFEPLVGADALLAEAKLMSNCVDQYAKRLAEDRCRLFSVRQLNGQPIATVEIGQHQREAGFLTITQLKGRHNMAAPVEVWRAAHTWMGQQKDLTRTPVPVATPRPIDNDEWTRLMAPYRSARGDKVALPLVLTYADLDVLDTELIEVARRAGINSWLFL